jgi:hypothetical protein
VQVQIRRILHVWLFFSVAPAGTIGLSRVSTKQVESTATPAVIYSGAYTKSRKPRELCACVRGVCVCVCVYWN